MPKVDPSTSGFVGAFALLSVAVVWYPWTTATAPYSPRQRAVVSTFRAASLRALAALEPDLCRGLTYPEDRFGVSRFTPLVRPGLTAMRTVLARRIGRMLSAARANAAMLHWQVVTSGVVERCHAVDAPVFAWTVLDAGEVRRLDELGVDGVIVDDPRIFEG